MDEQIRTDNTENTTPVFPTVELGGRLWELRFGHKAMRQFCRLTKCTLNTFDTAADNYENRITLLWIIMQQADPVLKREELEKWLDDLLLEDILTLTEDTIAAAFPRVNAKRKARQQKKKKKAADPDSDTEDGEDEDEDEEGEDEDEEGEEGENPTPT